MNLNPCVGTKLFSIGAIPVEEYYRWKLLLYIDQGYTHGEASRKKF